MLNPVCVSPVVQVSTAIDDLPTKPIEGWTDALMPPLRQLFAIADDIQFRIVENVVAGLLEEVCHLSCPFVILDGRIGTDWLCLLRR